MTKKNIKIIPAIMPENYEDLVSYTDRVVSLVDLVQIDVMDGKYTNSISWPYNKKDRHFDDILSEEEGFPNWENLNFCLDLMVLDPYTEALKWINTGVSEIVLHWGSLKKDDPIKLIKQLQERDIKVTIAKIPSEDISEFQYLFSVINSVQFMGIENVGFQGEPFVKDVIKQVSDFHKKYPDMDIMIDGGINIETAEEFKKAGADRLVSGSFIFTNQDGVKEAIANLKEAFN
jgi:ribulose-phosphate 3-epimerase